MTGSIIVAATNAVRMATRAGNDPVAGEPATPQPAPYPARPTPLTRTTTDSGPPKPVYALPNQPLGTWETSRTTSSISYTTRPVTDLNRVYPPHGNESLRSGFHCSPSEYSEQVQKDEPQCDPMAYGEDNRRQRSKERPAIERAAHKIKKRVVVDKTRRDVNLENAQDEAEHYRAEAKKWKLLAHELEDENIKYQETITRLRGDIDQERDRVERTKRSANKMQTTMDNRELFLGDQAHDDDVCGTFSGLITAIKTWSTRFSGGKGDSFKEERFPEYQRVAPLCSQLHHLDSITSNKKRKRLFVRGWTAYVMSRALFRTFDLLGDLGTDVWLETRLADDFSYLENVLWYSDRKAVNYRSFNDWRAFTAELLSKAIAADDINQRSNERTRQVVKDAVFDVMEVITPWHITGDPDELKTDEDKLYRIFNDAVSFARLLRRQRALWSIRFASRPRLPKMDETGPLMFDPTCMKDDRGDDEDMSPEILKQRYVEIVVTPVLYKRGTMNGERFESEEAVSPAVVVMGSA